MFSAASSNRRNSISRK